MCVTGLNFICLSVTGYRCLSFRHWFNLALSVFPLLVIGTCLSVTGLASSLFPSICQLVCWSVSVFMPVHVCRQSVSVQYALALSVRLPAYLDYIMTYRLFTGTTRHHLQLKCFFFQHVCHRSSLLLRHYLHYGGGILDHFYQ